MNVRHTGVEPVSLFYRMYKIPGHYRLPHDGKIAYPARLELATPSLEGWYSIH